MKEFRGFRTAAGPQVWIYEDGQKKRQLVHVVRHSPTGIEWGYGGSGPADLALSMLLEVLKGDIEVVNELYQTFKAEVVAMLPWDKWSLSFGEVIAWAKNQVLEDLFLNHNYPGLLAKLQGLEQEGV